VADVLGRGSAAPQKPEIADLSGRCTGNQQINQARTKTLACLRFGRG
jgi:hypothetical protein